MRARSLLVGLCGLLAAGGVLACAEPSLPDGDAVEGAEQPSQEPAPDVHRERLVARTQELVRALQSARTTLVDVGTAQTVSEARRTAEDAMIALVDGPDADEALLAVFPRTTSAERGGDAELDDAMSATLTAARTAGGSLGRSVTDVLRDPLAGDLGAWQRDPEGMLAWVAETGDAGDLGATERAVLELPGEGTRAIAWTLLATEARDLEEASASAERAIAHLDLVLQAFEDLLADAGEST